jgi:hypothetical protein
MSHPCVLSESTTKDLALFTHPPPIAQPSLRPDLLRCFQVLAYVPTCGPPKSSSSYTWLVEHGLRHEQLSMLLYALIGPSLELFKARILNLCPNSGQPLDVFLVSRLVTGNTIEPLDNTVRLSVAPATQIYVEQMSMGDQNPAHRIKSQRVSPGQFATNGRCAQLRARLFLCGQGTGV